MGQMNLLLFSIFDNPFTTEYTKRCVSFLRKIESLYKTTSKLLDVEGT